jgi:hypothetical protein
MREFLTLCGYDEAELPVELPRAEKAFAALGLGQADIDRARARVHKYYDVELLGVRKILRVFVRDFVNIVLLRDEGREKLGYSFMAPGTETLGSAVMCNGGDVGWMNSGWTYLVVLGCMFDRLTPALEAAEKLWLKTGIVAHCGNVKMDLGFFELGLIPRPDLIVTAGFLCDTSSKSHDLIHIRTVFHRITSTAGRTGSGASSPAPSGPPASLPRAFARLSTPSVRRPASISPRRCSPTQSSCVGLTARRSNGFSTSCGTATRCRWAGHI